VASALLGALRAALYLLKRVAEGIVRQTLGRVLLAVASRHYPLIILL
jgi:hypothetical protein